VILLDYRLSGADGLQFLGALEQDAPSHGDSHPRVLFCTGMADATFELEARALGAAGVVAKEQIARELIPAIRAVAGGESWFRYTGAFA
jgi:DNA-binding NarL/FixJ family response regulator